MLQPFANWFWIHNEYRSHEYMILRAGKDNRTFTEDLLRADLCYPKCENSNSTNSTSLSTNSLKLEVATRSQITFSGCTGIILTIEEWKCKKYKLPFSCCFAVPYWHSIHAPSRHAAAPWNSKARRNNLLCFIGGIWRGNNRARIVREMMQISELDTNATADKGSRGYGTILFTAPFFFRSKSEEQGVRDGESFYTRVWALYASSVFSWQPSGDTHTRRAFYDSWMLGCIPVISNTSAECYRRLFRGQVFAAAGIALGDAVVVLNDDVMQSGAAILAHLRGVSHKDIIRRRRVLAALAQILQWGYDEADDRADALLMTLGVALSPS